MIIVCLVSSYAADQCSELRISAEVLDIWKDKTAAKLAASTK